MMMSELSRFLLVSNGNVTGIVDRLVVRGTGDARARRNGDRRTVDRAADRSRHASRSRAMAAAHERWIDELLGACRAAKRRSS